MRFRNSKEWHGLYYAEWRPRLMHLSREDRGKLVRGCKNKAIYCTHQEAAAVIEALPLRRGHYLGSYDCPLCGGIHAGNRKYLKWGSARESMSTNRRL
jgi:hypothetical protein